MQMSRTRRQTVFGGEFFMFTASVFAVGLILGTISYCRMSDSILPFLTDTDNSFLEVRTNGEFGEILLKSLSASTIFLGMLFLLGFSAIGQPAEFAVVLVRGAGVGVTMAQVYSAFGKSGILSAVLLTLPSAIISAYGIIIGTREAVGLSNILLRDLFSERTSGGLLDRAKLYGTRFLVLEAIMAVSATADGLCSFAVNMI